MKTFQLFFLDATFRRPPAVLGREDRPAEDGCLGTIPSRGFKEVENDVMKTLKLERKCGGCRESDYSDTRVGGCTGCGQTKV